MSRTIEETLKANLEIDIKIARHVMGHAVTQDTSGEWWEGFTNVARYSDSLQSAWNAAERIIDTRRAYFYIERQGLQWKCEFLINNERTFAFADTAPLAICRAALKVVEQEVK